MAYSIYLNIGDYSVADLPEDDTYYDPASPWIEFADNLTVVSTEKVKIVGGTFVTSSVLILGNVKIL